MQAVHAVFPLAQHHELAGFAVAHHGRTLAHLGGEGEHRGRKLLLDGRNRRRDSGRGGGLAKNKADGKRALNQGPEVVNQRECLLTVK